MFKNYLKIALRNIKRHKGYSFINITGLAIGITCCILMLLWTLDELSWDKFHVYGDNIYRVIAEQQTKEKMILNVRTPDPLLPALLDGYSELRDGIRFQGFSGWSVEANGKTFTNDNLSTADPSFFKMFTFSFIRGNPNTALLDRYSIVLTESMAQKYFGDKDPMGMIVNIGLNFKVTGIIEDVPENSHIHFDGLFPIINMEDCWEEDFNDWERIVFYTYVQLNPNVSEEDFEKKIYNIVRSHHPESNISRIFLQPLNKIHLSSNYQWDLDNYKKGNSLYVYIFVLTAFCILGVACINFMNLVTARSSIRFREIGMRKVVGAQRKDIIKQFFIESILLAFISLIVAVFLAMLVLPVFNNLTGKMLIMDFMENGCILLGLAGITIFTGVLSASYPALLLSSFKPTRILKGSSSTQTGKHSIPRKILVIVQFSLTSILLIGTFVVNRQVDFMLNTDLGFDKDYILNNPSNAIVHNWETAKHELLQNPRILAATNSYPPNGKPWASTDFNWEGKSPQEHVVMYPYGVDFDYLTTLGMVMADGRFFSRKFVTDSSAYIINEAAARAMGMDEPIGKRFSYLGREGRIIGVIKNFHQSSLHNEIEPLVLICGREGPYICVKIDGEDVQQTLSYMEDVWKRYAIDGHPFQYEFLDLAIDRYYKNEKKLGTIFRYFSLIFIFISCLGLFGLASFTAEQRTKEIGIRKTLGATNSSIVFLLSNEFTKLVLIAIGIAWPIAYLLMKNWLQNFAYRANLNIWIFFLSGIAVLSITLLTVSYQSIKAATANPVESLRYE